MRHLITIDETKRAIHCTDIKREILYVKDNNIWEKDDDFKKTRKAINKIANKNSFQLIEYKKVYPDCDDAFSKRSDLYNKMFIEAYGGKKNSNEVSQEKIIRNICKKICISK